MKKLLTVAALAVSLNANAGLSDMQEGFLWGMGSLLAIGHIKEHQEKEPEVVYAPPPYPYGVPSPDPVRDAYERGVLERQIIELRRQQDYAFQCGRYGKYCDKVENIVR